MGKLWGEGITPKAIWHVVKGAAQRAGIQNLAPHDLRRTCARLCHLSGGELEQIQMLLGHQQLQTTAGYMLVSDSMILAAPSPLDSLITGEIR